ncbi:hypothetical protein [Spiroplasma endosymbiont of Lonchoptera lutea]|uniref:hypothetical protein n=1 Tax=Spiroplasma endosymbiont of Lonchoptera lutea TaxID=3066297 RepID=UPI0030D1FD67
MSPILRIAIALNTDIVNNPDSNFIWYRESGKFALKNESNITERLEPIDKTSKAKALENTNDECCTKQLEEDGNIKLDKARNHSVFNERDLHSVVVKFLHNSAFNISSKTIFHELSSKKVSGKNKWLHPDIVGVHFPFNDFSKKTLKLQKEYLGSLKTKFYSFELKKELSFANLRESYFQAVSNSSWANEGYLVALKISESNDFINELKRLNDAFNIGVIKLNPNNIKQSIILFLAKEKETLDWATIDRLVTENSDFKDFVRIVIQSLQANTIVGNFDKVLTDAEYENYINEKHIKE